ncbi:MAG: hypothetical protein V1872_10450 [bacterium]
MPYVIEVDNYPPNYPKACPFCEYREHEKKFKRKFKKAKWFLPIPGQLMAAGYKNYKIEYPICSESLSSLKKLIILGLLFIIVPWILFFTMIFGHFGTTINLANYILYLLLFCNGFGFILLFYRLYRILKFRIGYISDKNKIIYYCRSNEFAREFAKINNTISKYHLLVFKFR